jgi:hypothetical protein
MNETLEIRPTVLLTVLVVIFKVILAWLYNSPRRRAPSSNDQQSNNG